MRKTLNGLTTPSGLITYSDIPTILKVEDTGSGTKAKFTITLVGDLSASYDGQWYITLLGDSISNVINPEMAVSHSFIISNTRSTTAASICRALRNCPTVASNFKITQHSTRIELEARNIGPIFSYMTNFYYTNMPTSYILLSAADGTASSSLYGSLIQADIYNGEDYVTTLSKNYYGSEAAFNLSPVLTTLSEFGKATEYNIELSAIAKDGSYSSLGEIGPNYSMVGYMVNQGNKYNSATTVSVLAQNVLRGTDKGVYNKTLLYVYEPSIPLSFYTTSNATQHIDVIYRDSALNQIGAFDFNYTPETNNLLKETTITLSGSGFTNAFYVDVKFEDSNNIIRYNVIKPVKMTEYCQRVYFRNSYGGISFFDFTGQKSETRDLEIMTYEKNIFDYYTDPMNELEKIYDNTVKYTVSLKSHLFEKDGKYIFNDMLQSPELWVFRNGEKYAIIIDSISVDETNNNDIYEATLKYHYSMEPSLI